MRWGGLSATLLLGCYLSHERPLETPEDLVWLHTAPLAATSIVSVGSTTERRRVAEVPFAIGIRVAPSGRWAATNAVPPTLVDLDSGETWDFGALLGTDFDVACPNGGLGSSVAYGSQFRNDARALLFKCTAWSAGDRISSRAWELDLSRMEGSAIAGDCVRVTYVPTGERHVVELACPDSTAVREWIEDGDGARLPLPLGAHPFSRDVWLVAPPSGSPRPLTWVGRGEVRELIPDLGEGAVRVRVSAELALVSTDLHRYAVSVDGVLFERPTRCDTSGVSLARGDGLLEITGCGGSRALVEDLTTGETREISALRGTTTAPWGYSADGEWALTRTGSGSTLTSVSLVELSSLRAETLPASDADLGPIADVSFRFGTSFF